MRRRACVRTFFILRAETRGAHDKRLKPRSPTVQLSLAGVSELVACRTSVGLARWRRRSTCATASSLRRHRRSSRWRGTRRPAMRNRHACARLPGDGSHRRLRCRRCSTRSCQACGSFGRQWSQPAWRRCARSSVQRCCRRARVLRTTRPRLPRGRRSYYWSKRPSYRLGANGPLRLASRRAWR